MRGTVADQLAALQGQTSDIILGGAAALVLGADGEKPGRRNGQRLGRQDIGIGLERLELTLAFVAVDRHQAGPERDRRRRETDLLGIARRARRQRGWESVDGSAEKGLRLGSDGADLALALADATARACIDRLPVTGIGQRPDQALVEIRIGKPGAAAEGGAILPGCGQDDPVRAGSSRA